MVFMPKSFFRWAFYTVPRASMFDGKLCGESLGLEKSAVGRCGLLPLHGTAISPSTLMVYAPRASMFAGKLCGESLGLEKSAVGRCGLLPLHGTAISPSTLWYNENWEKCDSISRERCR